MSTPRPRSRQPKQLDAGIFQAEISSFALRLAAEGKAAKTIRTYTEAVRWFAAARLPSRASWEQVSSQDIQRRMAWLLDRHSSSPGPPSRLHPGPAQSHWHAPARGCQRRPFFTRCRQPPEDRLPPAAAGLPAIPLPPRPGRE